MADPNERDSDLNAEDPIESSSSQSNADEADPITPPEATEVPANGGEALPIVVGEDQIEETDEERAAREAEEELLWIFQATVFDQAGQKIGRVGQVYLDDQTQAPNWVTVKTGLFGMKEFFIPLDDAERQDKRITVPYSKGTVLSAPRTEIDQNLSPSEEDALYNHYQVEGKMTEVVSLEGDASHLTDSAGTADAADTLPGSDALIPEPAEASVPEPASGKATDFDALISEETAPVDTVPDEAFANPEAAATELSEEDSEPAVEAPDNPFADPDKPESR